MADSKSILDALAGASDALLELECFVRAIGDAVGEGSAVPPPAYLFPLERLVHRATVASEALEALVRERLAVERLP